MYLCLNQSQSISCVPVVLLLLARKSVCSNAKVNMQALVSFDMSTASWALVKWEEDGCFTVVQAGWVLEPHPVPLRKDLPANGLCRWTKRSAKYKVVMLDVSGEHGVVCNYFM